VGHPGIHRTAGSGRLRLDCTEIERQDCPMHEEEPRAAFTSMERSTGEDWAIIGTTFVPFAQKLPDRILAHLRLLDGDSGGVAGDRLPPSLQAASLARPPGAAEGYVVCAALPHIGAPTRAVNPAAIAA